MQETHETPSGKGAKAPLNLNERPMNIVDISSKEKQFASKKAHVAFEKSTRSSAMSACPCCGAAVKSQQAHVDLNSNHFVYLDKVVPLSPTKAELLHTLVKRSPGIVSHDAIIQQLWGRVEPEDPRNTIKVHISQLRKTLAPFAVGIASVLDVGYRFHLTGAK